MIIIFPWNFLCSFELSPVHLKLSKVDASLISADIGQLLKVGQDSESDYDSSECQKLPWYLMLSWVVSQDWPSSFHCLIISDTEEEISPYNFVSNEK